MFPQQTQTANRAGSMGHCKDRLLWLLHNYEALGHNQNYGGFSTFYHFRSQEQRLRVRTELMLALRDSENEWIWPASPPFMALPSRTATEQNHVEWENWAFCQASQSGKYFLLFLTCSDLETVHVSSGWARGLFLVCQVSLMMGIKLQETEASWTGNKPQGFGGIGIFFLPPNGKILAWA